ncbi:hypothetical protein DUI87_32866 [Hirundo rustica rustica]|uniref:Rho guanine nucleotide exchange factor 11 n=1 Tax=Hirundo rustica rustica TaxID=333673 RepID=A0A3M0IQ65_HIRRU|nr:hypothetical protein DUI87_32866 [Hirundo rustica rustica]
MSRVVPRLSSLSSSLSDSPSERRSPGHHRQPSDASESTGLVQRCVIIQRDQHGFGFTVSGDRVVLVQSVRPGGAAMRAGVQEGDRIVKVNGTMVTNSSHLEVVKLIKSGAYVALTLLGSPPGSGGITGSQQEPEPSGCPQRITEPRPLQDPEVQRHAAQILRNMLRQEEAELQRFQELLLRNPGAAVEEQLEGARRRLSQLQLKILQESQGSADSGSRPLPGEILRIPGSASGSPQLPGRFSRESQDGEAGLESSPGESDSVFQDLGILKSRPAHLGVFLRFLFSQADPTPLLFHLCSEVCCQQSNPKDSRALGRDIWNVFLDRSAPLRVKVSEQLLVEIEIRLRSGEDLRPALLEAQEFVLPEIQEQLQDYRTKRTLGLGSLYGENELQELELGNAQRDPREFRDRERTVAERQLGHLGDILSPMAFALSTFMAHAGIRLRENREFREFRNPGASEKIPDKDKWLPFFPKAKKSSSSKKEKEQRQNPILKYIGKPRSSSQSRQEFGTGIDRKCGIWDGIPGFFPAVKPGNVRTMIQHFENSHGELPDPGSQRLSTGSIPEDLLESDSSRSEVRLGRSESLKGREELRRSRRSELVPRSRSDVDMESGNSGNNSGNETPRLHSASSSASSLSNRSMDSPSLGFGADPFLPHLLEDEQGPGPDLEPDLESQNSQNSQTWQQNSPNSQSWQHSVSRELVANLSQREVDRQEVINARSSPHLRILRVLDLLFYQGLRREQLLSREELGLLFPNLPDLIGVHNSLWESMKKLREEGPIIRHIGDLLLARFDGTAKEEFQRVAATFCSCQSIALELIRTKQRKESRFQLFMQEAESNPQCRRLQLKDLIVSEMQRLTKYPLLLESIIKCTEAGSAEQEKLCRARDQCRDIVRFVNDAVRGAENRRRLQEHQRRLDTTALERTSNPLAAQFRNLDLTLHRMIHEGPLAWRVGKDKSVELHVVLLEELLVLLQRQDERLVLKCHSKGGLGASDTKQSFSPVLKLSSLLVRSVATDKRALFIICTSELGPQIYELVALTSSEKNTLELPEPAVSPELARGTEPEAEPEERPLAGRVPDSSGRAQPLRELPEPPGDPEHILGIPEPIPGVPKSLGSTGVAEAALEDVETLRLLIVRRLRPGRDPDPEDDVTPTASGQGWNSGASGREFHTSSWDLPMTSRDFPVSSWDSAMSSRDSAMSSREFPVSSQDFSVSSREFPMSSQDSAMSSRDSEMSSQEFPMSSQDSVMPSREFPMSSRDSEISSQEFPMSSQDSQEPDGLESSGIQINRKGNFFYLSLPTGPPQPGGDNPGDIGDTLGDTELILGTLEELRGKLLRLRALEAAHQQLLRSLGGGDATAPSVPDVPIVPGRARPPPGPQSSSRAPRGHSGTATPGTGSDSPAHL